MWAVTQILILIQFKKEQGNVEIKTNSYHQPLFDTVGLFCSSLQNPLEK